MKRFSRLQTTQPTSGGAVTAVTNCCANCVETSRSQQWGFRSTVFLGKPAMRTRCMAGAAPHTNSGPTTIQKQIWICDICQKQIHGRKQISIRCNRIEHWEHIQCAGIRPAQCTDTWSCHLHKESGLTQTYYHPTPPDHGPSPLPTPHLHHPYHHNQNTETRPTLPLLPQDRSSPNPILTSTHPLSPTPPLAKHIHISHTPPTPLIPRATLIPSTSAALDTKPQPHVPPTCPALTTTTPPPSPTPVLPSPSHLTSQHTHMQHKQQYTHHSQSNYRIHTGYHDNLTDRPKPTT